MPYFVFSVKPGAQLQQRAEFVAFAAASAHAKALRSGLPPRTLERIQVVFAEHAAQAEDLLLQVRHAQPAGDE